MTSNRPKLSLRIGDERETSLAAIDVVRHAIEHELCVRAVYNRGQVILAPHILYERHGDPHVDGVVLERDGQKPQEAKLGTFKLSGLRNIVATMEPVRPIAGFRRDDPRYGETILAAVGN